MKAIRKLSIVTVVLGILLITMLSAYAAPANYVMMDENTPKGTQLIVIENQVRMRDVDNQKKVIKNLKKGTKVVFEGEIIIQDDTDKKFAKVKMGNNVGGMIAMEFLAIDADSATITPTATPSVKPTVTPTVNPTVIPTVKPTATPIETPVVKPTITYVPSITPAHTATPIPQETQRVWSDQRTPLDKFKEIPIWAIAEVGVAVVGLIAYALYRKFR